jgi:hypothetical protein
LGKKANCRLRLEFYSSKVPVQPRGKQYLAQELDAYLTWGDKEGVPLYLGEFGTIRDSFLPERGGEAWVRDMLDLVLERELGFAYHDYHEVSFGLFVSDSGLPSIHSANTNLYEVLVKALVGPDADTTLTPPAQAPAPAELTGKQDKAPAEPQEKKELTYDTYDDFD